jgi:hypothetical protein
MHLLKPENMAFLAPERERAVDETSDESFDRVAFARHALDLLKPSAYVVAICDGATRMRVESGRLWGRRRTGGPKTGPGGAAPPSHWAMLAIPPRASRRAIALAIAELACIPPPYALDVLFA